GQRLGDRLGGDAHPAARDDPLARDQADQRRGVEPGHARDDLPEQRRPGRDPGPRARLLANSPRQSIDHRAEDRVAGGGREEVAHDQLALILAGTDEPGLGRRVEQRLERTTEPVRVGVDVHATAPPDDLVAGDVGLATQLGRLRILAGVLEAEPRDVGVAPQLDLPVGVRGHELARPRLDAGPGWLALTDPDQVDELGDPLARTRAHERGHRGEVRARVAAAVLGIGSPGVASPQPTEAILIATPRALEPGALTIESQASRRGSPDERVRDPDPAQSGPDAANVAIHLPAAPDPIAALHPPDPLERSA